MGKTVRSPPIPLPERQSKRKKGVNSCSDYDASENALLDAADVDSNLLKLQNSLVDLHSNTVS